MRPLRLRIEGFGAFAGRAEIDFSSCTGSTLLLIHGPTGAGKTTIFDALCFALYGISSGDRTPEQMRSDHCPPGTPTKVMCEFSLPSGVYRITREFKPRRNLDTVEEKGVLEFLDAAGAAMRPPVTKKTDIRDEVERLLGLNSDQFRQIVMLPQNDFQKMLLADTRAKQVILEKLFRASRYSRLTQILSEMTQEKRSAFDQLKNKISGFLTSYGVEDAAALRSSHLEAERLVAAMAARLPDLHKQWDVARSAREEGERVVGYHAELRNAREELRQHLALRPAVDDERLRLEAALRAEPLRSVLAEIQDGEQRSLERQRSIDALHAVIRTVSLQKDEAQREVDLAGARNEEILRLQVEMHRLESARPQLLQLERARLAAGEIDLQLRELGARMQEYAVQKETVTGELMQHDADLPGLEATVFTLSGLQESLRRTLELQLPFTALGKLREQTPALRMEVAGAETALGQAAGRSRAAAGALTLIEKRWVESQASRLSGTLTPGQPCPVCGSPDHPHPARSTSEGVTDAALAAARAKRDATERELQYAQARLVAAKSALAQTVASQQSHESLLGEFAGDDPSAFAARLRQQERDLDAARKSADRLEEVRKRTTLLAKRLQELQRELDLCQEQNTGMSRERATAMAQMQSALGAIGEDVPDIGTLENRQREARLRSAALTEQIADAQARHATLAGEVIRLQTRRDEETKERNAEAARIAGRRKELTGSLVRSGFSTSEDVASALLPDDQRRQLNDLVHRWDEKAITLRNTVEERQRVIAGRSAPDSAELSRVEERARGAHDAELQRATEARAATQRLEEAIVQLQGLTGRLESLRSEAGQIQELSDAVSGKNEMGITLSSYVLSVFLDEIVTFANSRLRVISHDRYTLVRRAESDDRRKRAGLDLDVFDSYTGEQRQVQTLSGGEQFYAALSLALGVADAAQQHTGGVRMDAMFIDEGFGSLDSETLDVAIRALMDLQADGRLVAIISHVEELKTRIPVRLEVVKEKTGSSIRWSES